MDKDKEFFGTIIFDSEDKIYADHFPGNPVVPGSIIINSLLKILEKESIQLNTVKVKGFKFKHFVNPGEYSYSLEKSDNYYKFSLNKDSKIFVTGNIECN